MSKRIVNTLTVMNKIYQLPHPIEIDEEELRQPKFLLKIIDMAFAEIEKLKKEIKPHEECSSKDDFEPICFGYHKEGF